MTSLPFVRLLFVILTKLYDLVTWSLLRIVKKWNAETSVFIERIDNMSSWSWTEMITELSLMNVLLELAVDEFRANFKEENVVDYDTGPGRARWNRAPCTSDSYSQILLSYRAFAQA